MTATAAPAAAATGDEPSRQSGATATLEGLKTYGQAVVHEDGEELTAGAGLFEMAVDGGGRLQTYGLDVDNPTQQHARYGESDWSRTSLHDNPDAGKILWILRHSYPQVDDLRAVEARVAGDAALEVLVNDAGFLTATPFVEDDPEAIEAMLRVHVVAPVRLCRAALPGMLARDRGAVVNVSSIGAWDTGPSPRGAVYSATKAFVNTFTLGLESQVRGTGVGVQALCPAATRTEIHARAGVPFDYPASAVMTPNQP